MASTLPFLFLSLLIFLPLSLSASLPPRPSTSPPRTPPSHIHHAPASKPKPQPQPSPPAPTPVISPPDHQMNNIVDAMIGSGDFGNWINLLMSTAGNSSTSSIIATLFVPDDVALPQPKNPHPYPNQQDLDPFLFAYHAVPRRLSFADLLALPIGSRLPTLLPGNSLLVTNNSLSNFTVNDSPITHPDLFLNVRVSVQGIGEAFDYKRFGTDRGGGATGGLSVNRPEIPPPQSPQSPPSPRLIRRPPPFRTREAGHGFRFFPGEVVVSGARRSGQGFFFGYWLSGIGNVIICRLLASIR